ncbi:golgin subfamily B member 1-like [Mugil cephalus]|uniref:golgin subfamily B member 1-like n=1 Tax=Mugil cephalus TaxID=48193 RepID=UPI001FB688BD|nr:golgin subfamily B member 1-like [Mugil cephalus]XP_047441072.1 golgin subfamily B member 1-like [Mugil cephalus]
MGTGCPMEDHMTSSDTAGPGCSSVTMATDSTGTGRFDLRVLCDRVEVLEQKAGSDIQSDSYLRNRIRELERSERSLLLQLYQLVSSSKLPSMLHSQRLDQRLNMLREEVRTMSQEKERGERVWRDRLQRCQRQLKAKEEEMSRQSQYFENFKAQLQHKLSLFRDREQTLQSRIYSLEKQLLDMTVSAATGTTTIRAVRITRTNLEEQDRLPSLRGEGEGEEEKKEERRKQWQSSVEMGRKETREGDDGQAEKDIEGDSKYTSNEARLQSFIISLQEDLKVLLEREEGRMTERRGLMEQLQEAQENNLFMGCRVDEMKAQVQQLKLSESSLLEEVEELREENQRLQQTLRDSANQTQSQPSPIPESTRLSPGNISPGCSPAVCSGPNNTPSYSTAMGKSTAGRAAKVQPISDEGSAEPNPPAVSPVYHQATAESALYNTEDRSQFKTPSIKQPLSHFTNFQSLTLTTESLDEFKLGTWCSKGVLNLEEIPSEESDALRDAFKSLGLGEDLQTLREQRDRLEVSLQHTQEQLRVTVQENSQLKLQLRKQAEEQQTREKISDEDNLLQTPATEDDTILAQDDLVQALNQENRALADRIQELLAHIELREEEITKEQTQLKEHISRLEEDGVRLEQENQEHGCLISELTKKTEDDLNTIMELQQKLSEGREEKEESQVQWQCSLNRSFLQNNLEESVDSVVASVLKGEEEGKEEAQLMFSQEIDALTTTSVFGCQINNQKVSLKNMQQSTLHVSALTDQVSQLTNSAQSLKAEQEELTVCINSLREQQREVALSIKTQTEEKQQLTRTVWGLKEEKDCVAQSLSGLKMEKEQLSRAVCALKDEREQFIVSLSGLKEEKEHLTKSLSALERDKEAAVESLSREKEERDQIKQSVQTLQAESEQLNQTVFYFKQEREKLTNSLKPLKEQSDREQLSYTSKEGRDRLIQSLSSLKEEKERTENSIRCLKEEEKQLTLLVQGLRENRNSLQALPIEAEESSPLNVSTCATKKTESLAGDCATQRCQTKNRWGNSIQEQSDLMKEIEALGEDLKRSREELEKCHAETKRLRSELCQSEARRDEAERKATHAAEKVARLTDASSQMEETRMENDNLATQVKELQSKVTGLLKEKTDALSLKARVEEQYNVLSAQLRAKTVALEELNSEYIALKRGQGSGDDLSTALVSLRSRYNDIRAKYDALLKRKSQTDLDIAPLKAKMSCLVVKCQERNSLLVHLMKAMHRQGCVDPQLTQQVEQLLSDAALQDYTAAFTPETYTKTKDYSEFISKFQGHTSALMPDHTCPVVYSSANKQQPKHSSIVTTESSTNFQDCSTEVMPAATETLKKNTKSPVPTSPVQEHSSVQVAPSPKESLITNTAQLSPSARRNLNGSSLSPTPRSSSACVGVSRRLSSPEKILNLHEQLQKTLMSSYQTHESRGRGEQPRKSLCLSAPTDQNSASLTKNLSFNISHCNALPVATSLSQAKHTPVEPTKPPANNKSTTLFNAVVARSANATFSPSIFTNHGLKVDVPKITTSVLSNFSFAASGPSKDKPIPGGASNMTISPKPTKKITTVPEVSHPPSTSLTPRTTNFGSDVTSPRTTASDATAPINSTAPENIMISKIDGADRMCRGFALATSRSQSACSTERSSKSARKSTAAPLEETKTARPKPEAPAEVCCVEVLKTVGQSSLMIGWERPPLDELGCSNGTFVYGYRVFVDGDFHKSVMSSACTKCILENVDLSVPVHISIQTLGSNGLNSNSVHTMYRASVI